jgi:hypothetical protein
MIGFWADPRLRFKNSIDPNAGIALGCLPSRFQINVKIREVPDFIGAPDTIRTCDLCLRPGETVIFAWITYKSRAQRDRVNAKVMADKRLAGMMDTKSLPFDAKRMIYGGFESLVKV